MEGSGWIHLLLVTYGYDILHLMGDVDANVPLLSTLKWLQTTNWKTTKPWTPYTTPDGELLLGFTKQYADHFTLATLRRGGHGAGFELHEQASQLITDFMF